MKNNIKTKDSLVSVVIPAYNHAPELRRAISSVLAQSWQDFEIVVVDDGSSVGLKNVCVSFKDDRIRYIRYNEHANANVARNIGIREARGEFIAMLDADDEFLPYHLERRIKKIKEWNCDGVFGSALFDNGVERKLILSRPRRSNELMINYLLSDGFAPTPSHFYRRGAALEILWDETLERHQDYDFSVRFIDKYTFISDYEPTVVINWKVHEKRDLKFDSCIRFIDKHKGQISDNIYNDYHYAMYFLVQKNTTVDKSFEKHYAINSYRYIYAVNFSKFLSVHKTSRVFHVFIFSKFILLHIFFFLKKLLLNMSHKKVT